MDESRDVLYKTLLNRIQGSFENATKKTEARLEIPEPQILWVGAENNF